MLNEHDVIAFAATTHPEKSKAFYAFVLGLRLVADEEFAIVFDAHGTMLRIQKVHVHEPAPFTALGWHVTNIEHAVDELTAKGVQMTRYDGFDQDARGIWNAPGGARIAWFKDPDGNTLSLTQF
jgi:catechol 2,3-dioxygenase-like lactoylglutathione lyase family enzyme